MSEFKENVILSTNILFWLLIINYVIVAWFDPYNNVSARAKDVFAIFAVVSVLALLMQAFFFKIIEVIKELLKCYDITIVPRKR
jgi:hypothetical protein